MKSSETKQQQTSGKSLTSGVKVSWGDKKSESGIEIAGGPTVVERFGTIIGTTLLPVQGKPGAMSLVAVVAGDDKQFHTIPLEFLKIL